MMLLYMYIIYFIASCFNYICLTPLLSSVLQTTTHTSFLISGIRGQVLSSVHASSDGSVSPLAHDSARGKAAPKLSPPQPKSLIGDQEYQVHSLPTAQVQVHVHCMYTCAPDV